MLKSGFFGRPAIPLVAAVMMVAAGCGGSADSATPAAPSAPVTPEWQKTIDAAKTEGTVTVYSSQGSDQLNDLAKRFEQAYGIHVDVLRDVDANLEAKVDAEHASGQPIADVVALADGAYVTAKGKEGRWAAPSGPDFQVPAYDRSRYLAEDGSFVSSAAVFVLAWNTQSLPAGLRSFSDLLNPELVGKIGVNDPAVSPAVVDFYSYLQEQNGPGFVDQLAAQKPQIFPSVLPMGQALTAGQVWAVVGGGAPVDEMEQGAPVDFLVPNPAWGALFRTAVLANAPHPNAAQLFANFLITAEGQDAIAHEAASVLPDIPSAVANVADVRAFDPANLTTEQIETFRAEFRQKFQQP